MATKKITKETTENSCSNHCPCSQLLWLIIPVFIGCVTWWILKSNQSLFSSDPLSFWFSMVLSVFVGLWMAVGIKRIIKYCPTHCK